MLSFSDLNVENQRVLIREDFNVPREGGRILNEARILAALPTLRMALRKKAKIILISHLGRPTEGQWDASLSLEPVADRLSQLLNFPVRFVKEWLDKPLNPSVDEIVFCENTRFLEGEKRNAEGLAKRMAALCDCFVMDAFAVAHRAEASTVGVAQYAPVAVAGPLLVQELEALGAVVEQAKHPVVAIVGGSKVSTKLDVLKALLTKVDVLVLGGGIANTFLAAKGYPIGRSLVEMDFLEEAKTLMAEATAQHKMIWLPQDVRVSTTFDASAQARVSSLDAVTKEEMILDIGPNSEKDLAKCIRTAGTILWNGPVGVFEFPAFAEGTRALAEAVAASEAYSVAGGGDTLHAIEQFGIEEGLSYISTGGGAFLEFIEGKTLPGVKVLQDRAEGQGGLMEDILCLFSRQG